jgi:GDSL-like Lipase/Acylhydrolase family
MCRLPFEGSSLLSFKNATLTISRGAARRFKTHLVTLDWKFAILRHILFRIATAFCIFGSFVLLPIVVAQGAATRRRVPRLPPARPPHHGVVPGFGNPIRLLAIGESTVSGLGLASGEEAIAATSARALARRTGRSIEWRAEGLSGATVSEALKYILPRITPEEVDLIIVAFGVNDTTAYRSPSSFADDLAELVMAVRKRVGDAAVVIGSVAPLNCFPALP